MFQHCLEMSLNIGYMKFNKNYVPLMSKRFFDEQFVSTDKNLKEIFLFHCSCVQILHSKYTIYHCKSWFANALNRECILEILT